MAESPSDTGPTQREPKSLVALVAQCIDRMEAEGPGVLDELCLAHPEHAPKLRAHIARLQRVGLVGAMPAAADLPERLGAFRILALLGRGGMGVVYLAEQEGLQRRVALKLVRPEHLFFPGARQRFKREIEAASRLQHPGIIPVFAAGEEHGVPFYAMEYVRGAALEEVLATLAGSNVARLSGADLLRAVNDVVRRREQGIAAAAAATPATAPPTAPAGSASPRPMAPAVAHDPGSASTATATSGPGSGTGAGRKASSARSSTQRLFAGTWTEAALRVAQHIAVALQHAHEQGVLHRDVKPSNVMLTPEGRVLLLDFGLAAAEGSTRLTSTGSQLGSLAWMSPEQVRGGPDPLDERTDVYSLGATLYELLALRSPFADASVDETRQRILDGRAAPLRELNPAVPRDAETVCLKAMECERDRRYPSAADFAEDIGNALELRPVHARRAGTWLKSRRWAQRNPAAAVAAVLGALLLVGGPVGYGVVQGRAAAKEELLNEDLARSNVELDGANSALQETNTKLQDSLAAERRQRERAQRAFDRSLEAVDSLLADVGSQDLRDVPQFSRVRSGLLERALDFYRALEADDPGNIDVRKERARTHRSIADLLVELGRSAEARALYEQAVAELSALLIEHPDDRDLRYTHASCLSQLATRDQQDGNPELALTRWDQAREELQTLVAEQDALPGWTRDLAIVLSGLALIAHEAGDDETALALHEEAAALLEPLVSLYPESSDIAYIRAVTLSNAATVAAQMGRADAAEALHRETWQSFQELLAREPWRRRLRVDAVECASNFGLLLLVRSNREEAESVLHAGWQLARDLADEYPEDPDYARKCGHIGLNLAAELFNQDRAAAAEVVAEESCRMLQAVAERSPEDVQQGLSLGYAYTVASAVHQELGALDLAEAEAARGVAVLRDTQSALHGNAVVGASLAAALCQVADVSAERGVVAQALLMVDEALTLASGRPDVLYMAAETLGHCLQVAHASAAAAAAAAAESESAESAAEALAPVDLPQLTQLTLDVLREAVSAGFNDAQRLRTTESFENLRTLPEFAAILRAAGG